MKGSLQELGDRQWRLRVFAGRQNGKVRHVSRNFNGTKRQAQTALAQLVSDVERQQIGTAKVGTLGEMIDRWLNDIGPHRSTYTMQEYRRLVAKTIEPALGKMWVDKITGRDLDGLYLALQQRGLSNSSVHQHHSILHAALGRAVKWGLIPSNPADRATPPSLSFARSLTVVDKIATEGPPKTHQLYSALRRLAGRDREATKAGPMASALATMRVPSAMATMAQAVTTATGRTPRLRANARQTS